MWRCELANPLCRRMLELRAQHDLQELSKPTAMLQSVLQQTAMLLSAPRELKAPHSYQEEKKPTASLQSVLHKTAMLRSAPINV